MCHTPLPSNVLTGTEYAIDVFYSEGHTDLDDYAGWLELKITSFESKGFKCTFEDTGEGTKISSIIAHSRINTPYRRFLREEDISRCLDKLEVGNALQINALCAWQYLQFARAFWEGD